VVDKAISLSSDGKLAIFRYLEEPAIELFDIEKTQVIKRLYFSEPIKRITPLIVGPDVLTETYLKWEEGELETIVDFSDYQVDNIKFIEPEDFEITALAMSKETQFVVGGNSLGEIFIIDSHTGNLMWKNKGHKGPVECISISPDGKYAASGGKDNEIVLWLLNTFD
jgi:WD40 repeat protein